MLTVCVMLLVWGMGALETKTIAVLLFSEYCCQETYIKAVLKKMYYILCISVHKFKNMLGVQVVLIVFRYG